MRVCTDCSRYFQGPKWKCPYCGHCPEKKDGIWIFSNEQDLESLNFPDTHEALSLIEEKSFWFRHRNKVILSIMDRWLPQVNSLLEVGCGNGFVLQAIIESRPDIDYFALELSFAGLRTAAKRIPQAELLLANITSIPYREEFELVCAFDVLEHIESDDEALEGIRQALKPGGSVMLTVPHHPRLWSLMDELSGHQRRYTRQGLRKILKKRGFRLIWDTSFMSTLLPFFFLGLLEWKGRHPSRDLKNASSMLAPSPTIDRTMEILAGLELPFLKRGVSLPFGGSFLSLAQRI